MKQKGAIFVSMIMLLIVYLAACAVVFIFFHFFKYHIIKTVLDEYRWNKIQEIPLALFSMDIDRESFTLKMNKIYYELEPEDEFVTKMHEDVINQQLFYQFPPDKRPFGYFITIGKTTLSEVKEVQPNCECEVRSDCGDPPWYYCSDDCGSPCTNCGVEDRFGNIWPDERFCYPTEAKFYAEEYPFPLTFNGTERFIESLSYEATAWK